MDVYSLLPKELQLKIKYMTIEHPTAQIMKEYIKLYNIIYKSKLVHFVDYTKWHTVYGYIKINDIKHYSITTNSLFDEDQGVVRKDDKWFLWVRKHSHGDVYKQIPNCINVIYKIDNGLEFIKIILENQALKHNEELFDDIIDNDSDSDTEYSDYENDC